MADDVIDVKIIIDTSSLQAGSAQASAAVAASTAQIRASAVAAGVALDDMGKTATGAVPAFIRFGGGVINAQKALKDTGDAAKKTSEAVAGMHGSISTATREFRALFDELSSGRTRMTPGTLAIIGNRVLGLGPAALASVGGVIALAGALAYLGVTGVKAANAVDSIHLGAAFAGDVLLTRDQIAGMIARLDALPGVSQKDAEGVVGAFARMKDSTAPEVQALAAEIADFAQASGQSLDKAASEWVKSFADPTQHASAFVASLHGVTTAQTDAAAAAERAQNPYAAAAAMLGAFDEAVKRLRPAMDAHNRSIFAGIGNILAYAGAAVAGISADQMQTVAIKDQNDARAKQAALIKQSLDLLKTMPLTPQQTLTVGLGAGASENTEGTRRQGILADVDKINAALQVAKNTGDQVSLKKLNDDLIAAQANLASLDKKSDTHSGPSQLDQWRLQLAEMQAASDGNRAQELAREQAFWQSKLALVTAGSKEALAVQQEVARTTIALNRQVADAAKQAAAEQARAVTEFARQTAATLKSSIEETQRATETAARESAQAWNQGFATIDRAAIPVLDDMLTRQRNVGASAKEAVQKMVLAWVNGLAEIMLKLAAFEALKAAAGLGGTIGGIAGAGATALGGQAGGAGTPATGLAAILPSGLSSLLGVGAQSGATANAGGAQQLIQAVTANTTATTSNTSGLSGMLSGLSGLLGGAGKLLSGGIGGLFGGGSGIMSGLGSLASFLPALATGAWNIPSIMPALLHPGEMVLPAPTAAVLRGAGSSISGAGAQPLFGATAMAGAGAGAGAGGAAAGGVTLNANFSSQNLDNRSAQQFLNSPTMKRTLAQMVQSAMAKNPSLQGAY